MRTVSLELKDQLSKYLTFAKSGEEVVIRNRNRPVLDSLITCYRLVPSGSSIPIFAPITSVNHTLPLASNAINLAPDSRVGIGYSTNCSVFRSKRVIAFPFKSLNQT